MRRKFTSVLLVALGFLTTTMTVSAQTPETSFRPELVKMSPAERAKATAKAQAQFPAIKSKMLEQKRYDFPMAATGIRSLLTPQSPALAPARLRASANLYVNGDFNNLKTYYSTQPASPLTFTAFAISGGPNYLMGLNGASLKDGHIRGAWMNTALQAMGIVSTFLTDFNLETGEFTASMSSDNSLSAVETAQAADGTVYGEFYNKDLSGYEFGVIDYEAKSRTTFGTTTHYYVAMGISKGGTLYGIADDGNLYTIDTTNGAETLVGSTGLTLTGSDNKTYYQTGEIDQKDDTFYWYCATADQTVGLYTVDLTTGAATKIADAETPAVGMVIPAPEAEDGAPSKVADLAAHFVEDQLTGTLDFTAPSTTYGGTALTGTIGYKIYIDGELYTSGTATAGTAVSAEVTTTAGGLHTFAVTTSTDAGDSPQAAVTVWNGLDIPFAVTDLTFNVDDNGLATIAWTAPTAGTHDGYIGNVTYDVYRIVGDKTETVGEGLTTTTVTDQLDLNNMAIYSYAVYARNAAYRSDGRTTDGKLIGTAIRPTWSLATTTSAALDYFTVIDANNDGFGWRYNSINKCISSESNWANGNDDWLITPPIHLTTDRTYTFSFVAKNQTAYFPNTMEVKVGNAPTVEGMTTTLLETTTPGGTLTTYSFESVPFKEGDYYFGIHDNTADADMYFLNIYSVSITANPRYTSPDSVTNLKVVPGPQGALTATISFNAPTITLFPEPLAAMDSIVVSRGNETVKVFSNPTPGAALSFEDAVTAAGSYTYTVAAYLDGEYGCLAEASAFIGPDKPQAPQNVKLADNNTTVLASWDAISSTGANGGYVDPAATSVTLYQALYDDYYGYYVGDQVGKSANGATSTELNVNPDEDVDGSQALVNYFARATNATGNSSYVASSSLIVGKPLALPFKESLASGQIENGFVWQSANEQAAGRDNSAYWHLSSESADGDGGSAVWGPFTSSYGTNYTIEEGDAYSFNLPKVTLAGASNPQLVFSLYANAGEQAKVEVNVQLPDGTEQTAATFDLSQRTADGWQTEQVSLKDYAACRYVVVKFNGVSEGSDTYIGLDNINILDQKQYDLQATSLSLPTSVKAGTTAKAVVGVKNLGANAMTGYDVVLYAQDEPVDTVKADATLEMMAETSFTLNLPVKVTEKSSQLSVRAEVVSPLDEYTDNNATETQTVSVEQPTVSTVSDLTATADNGVALTWTKPETKGDATVTETFEDYDNYVTAFGDWTTIDNTNAYAGGYSTSYVYPSENKQFAFTIFNGNDYDGEGLDLAYYNPGFAAHSGSKYAMSPYRYTASSYPEPDEWLISPALSGKEQTVTLYAMNLATSDKVYTETFDVLASTTDKQQESFTKIGDTQKADGTNVYSQQANWKEISVTLPEGTKYFAIHQNTASDDTYLFGLDDITYERAMNDGTVIGYNIYRDGELIATVDGTATGYTDSDDDGEEHTYNVTVVYQDADSNTVESAFSNDATIATSISAIEGALQATAYDVFTLDGKAVRMGAKTLSGLKRGVYMINGKKFILK